jgi:hypothetical protein
MELAHSRRAVLISAAALVAILPSSPSWAASRTQLFDGYYNSTEAFLDGAFQSFVETRFEAVSPTKYIGNILSSQISCAMQSQDGDERTFCSYQGNQWFQHQIGGSASTYFLTNLLVDCGNALILTTKPSR